MSSQRGNCAKTGPQKHQNTRAYRNDLHRKDKTIKTLKSMQIAGCCKRCKEVIEWKIKYNKYKPLTRAKKCVKCQQKSVTNSYYIICQSCIESLNLCGKCATIPPVEPSAERSDAAGSEINTKSSLASGKRKPEEEEDDSDASEDDSDLDDEVEKVLTIDDKVENQVSVEPSLAKKRDGTKRKNAELRKVSDKQNVRFATSDSEEEEDDTTAFVVDNKRYEDTDNLNEGKTKGKDKTNKGKDKTKDNKNEGKDKTNEGKDKTNEAEDNKYEGKDKTDEGKDKPFEDKYRLHKDKVDRNKLPDNVKKAESDESEIDDSEEDDEDGNDEEDDGDEEDN